MIKIKMEIPGPPASENVDAASCAPHLPAPEVPPGSPMDVESPESPHDPPGDGFSQELEDFFDHEENFEPDACASERLRGLYYLTCPDISQVSQAKGQYQHSYFCPAIYSLCAYANCLGSFVSLTRTSPR